VAWDVGRDWRHLRKIQRAIRSVIKSVPAQRFELNGFGYSLYMQVDRGLVDFVDWLVIANGFVRMIVRDRVEGLDEKLPLKHVATTEDMVIF
jgi:hypothetical protein